MASVKTAHDNLEGLSFWSDVKLDTNSVGLCSEVQIDPVIGYTTSFVGRRCGAFPTLDKFGTIGGGESGQVYYGHIHFYDPFFRKLKQNIKLFLTSPKCSRVKKFKYHEWYAIVVRRQPEVVLVVDRSLTRAWTVARVLHPELGPEDLAFRTLPGKEFDVLTLKT
jgi:hypothetical protein